MAQSDALVTVPAEANGIVAGADCLLMSDLCS